MLKLEQFCTNVTNNIVQPFLYVSFSLINFQQFIKNNNDNRNKNNHKKHVDLRNTLSHKHFITSNTNIESKQSVESLDIIFRRKRRNQRELFVPKVSNENGSFLYTKLDNEKLGEIHQTDEKKIYSANKMKYKNTRI